MRKYVIVFCTVGRIEEANALARSLVEKRLVACVSVLPRVTSHYFWKNELMQDEESLLVIKTQENRFEELRSAIVAKHAYEVPEVIALPIVAGHAPYLAWIDDCLK